MDKEQPKQRKTVADFMQLGLYVGYVVLTYELLLISQVSNLIYMSYGGAAARVVGCGDESFLGRNLTNEEMCAEYERVRSSNSTCEPVLDAEFKSINYEFGYFCSTAHKVKTSTSIQMFGIIFGAMTLGQISDTFGRKKALIFGTIGLIVSGFISTFATGLWTVTAARIFVMFFTGGKHSVCYVFMTENLPPRHRLWILTLVTYSPNYFVFTGMAYLTGEWRLLSRLAAGFTIIPLILLIFVKESPRWLIQKGKIDEAREAILSIGAWDRSNTPEKEEELDAILNKERARLQEASDNNEPPQRYYTYHLFSSPTLAKYSCFFAYSLMITSAISYGITFNTEKLSGSVFLNIIIIGSLRYLVNIVAAIVDIKFKWCGRRLLHGLSMGSICGCLVIVFIIMVFGLDLPNAMRIFALAASAICSEIYILNSVQPSELFPTAIRNIGIGFIQTFNRIGNTIAPQIFVIGALWLPLPFLVMSVLSFVEVVSYLGLIPETKGKPMVESMPGQIRKAADSGGANRTVNGNVEEEEFLKK